MQPGQTTSESTIIGTSGKEFNALDTAKWIESARTSAEGRMQIYNEARREGMSLSSINPLMGWSANTAEDWARSMGLPTFATGGTASGWSMVGERGPELARFDAPARIYPAEQTRSMMSPASNDALLAKIDVLTQRVEQLTRVVADGDGANVAATDRVSQTHGDAAWRQEISQQRAA